MSLQLIQQYHAKVEKVIRYSGSRNESALRKPFQDLLEAYALGKNLLLVTEVELRTRGGRRVIPDGTLKDALRQDWGYWESKDEKDNLADEIAAKFAKGYPSTNILFEDTRTAVLYQDGEEALQADFTDVAALDALLTRFVSYEPSEVTEFHRAIEQFDADVPALAAELRAIIEEQYTASPAFEQALNEFLELCQAAINPRVEMADMREMIIQHVLTEDIFMTVFDEPQFHRENAIARKLQEVVDTFYQGATRRNIHARIAPYYETINARAAQIYNHWEKQKFLKALYENFYRVYNPKAADRLGVIYTPDEIVRFIIHAADHLAFQHFGRTLGDAGVEILDPAAGTGTFITELIEYLPESQLKYKYQREIHCNEVAILPYYIANLNIEYTYKQKTGQYLPFGNICFVDTLDNMGFLKSGQHQMDFLAMVDENIERVQRQNERRISVIIGNPPYNANQLNENENNKNREYPEIDRRIKDTYIRHSTAQKTKLYDMYTRFLRWASDRLDRNGIIAFVSNNSFLDARSYDGFRRVVAEEFNHIYVIDLKGDARTSGERRRREGGSVFSDQIRVGVAVYFLVRKEGETGCRIHYNAVDDYARAEEKKAYLRDNRFTDLQFHPIHPDQHHNWLNLAESDWDEFIPVASKETREDASPAGIHTNAIFKFFSLGVSTNRDEWVFDFDAENLRRKAEFFIDGYNGQVDELRGKSFSEIGDWADYSIKWSDTLKRHLIQGIKLDFGPGLAVRLDYRPFVEVFYYAEKALSDRLTSNHFEIFGEDLRRGNSVIVVNISDRPFNALATKHIVDLHFNGDSQCLPLYRYTAAGERVDNITDWALARFQERYGPHPWPLSQREKGAILPSPRGRGVGGEGEPHTITKPDIFHYVYAVLHHPAYRQKYALNLKREFPRIPFHDDFWQWAEWGRQLMELHLNYEQAEPYPLAREDQDPQKPGFSEKPGFSPKPRLIARKDVGVIEVDTVTTLRGVPPEVWEYRLGTYSALEWVLERHKERTPKDPTIRERFNTYRFADYKEHVIDLLCRVCTVSVETMKIIRHMPG